MHIPLKMAFTTIANLFKPPVTSKFPKVARPYFPRSRGHIRIDFEQCVFCGACQRKCPTDAIAVSRNDKEWSIRRLACIACGGCVEACPKKCLYMENQATSPVGTADKDSTVEKHKGA